MFSVHETEQLNTVIQKYRVPYRCHRSKEHDIVLVFTTLLKNPQGWRRFRYTKKTKIVPGEYFNRSYIPYIHCLHWTKKWATNSTDADRFSNYLIDIGVNLCLTLSLNVPRTSAKRRLCTVLQIQPLHRNIEISGVILCRTHFSFTVYENIN